MNSHLQLALWIAHPVLQLGVVFAMLRRKQHQVFPVFFSYALAEIAGFAILFPIHKWCGYAAYFYTYWLCAAVTLAIGFKVIHEVFLDIFRPYHTLKDLGTVMFKWAGLVMLMAAGVIAAASPASDQGPVVQAIITMERCVRVIQCGLILFLIVFSKYLGVSWKQRSFGIAMGFGGSAIVEQIGVALRASSYLSEPSLNVLIMSSYNIAILLWFAYIFVEQPARSAIVAPLASQRWDQSLSDLQRPAGADSLIPMFEGMVDRAFSNTSSSSFQQREEPEERPLLIASRPVESAPRAVSRSLYQDRLVSKA
ncbi:MAG: hypothetical protein JWO91_1563 [Acidobacteriaceae bacterium]|nr:hypothetical protein [Acidobacteriaceae bacterium]